MIVANFHKGINSIVDGNFYHKNQLTNLIERLPCPHHAFTLAASLDTCIERDAQRREPHGEAAADAVYRLVTRFDHGHLINTDSLSVKETIARVLSHIDT